MITSPLASQAWWTGLAYIGAVTMINSYVAERRGKRERKAGGLVVKKEAELQSVSYAERRVPQDLQPQKTSPDAHLQGDDKLDDSSVRTYHMEGAGTENVDQQALESDAKQDCERLKYCA